MRKEINLPNGEILNVEGKAMVLSGNDIDTDRIIPARFLKCVSFNDLGEQVFADDRIEMKGSHPFDLKINQEASLLVVNDNFGCGSSREHAPQALMRWGIRAIIGQSFAEIFFGNCLALGIPCVTSNLPEIQEIQGLIKENKKINWNLNIEKSILSSSLGTWAIQIEKGSKKMLTSGKWDATSQLISQEQYIKRTISRLPYLNNFFTE